jgi:glycosyltransferase involved in cell wall biosynthesis
VAVNDMIPSPEHVPQGSAGLPLVSIIITGYNHARYLGEAIESALSQTYSCCEIVVVDDGSTDDTGLVVGRYPSVRSIAQTNQGLSAARNTGVRVSRGAYLIFLDADDRLLPGAVRAGLACLADHPEAALAYGHHRFIAEDGSLLNEYPPEPLAENPYLALLKRNFIAMHGTVIYPRTTLETVGLFDRSLASCEDYDLYLRVARHRQIAQHAEVVAEYRFHGGNMSHNAARMLATALTVLNSQSEYIRGRPALLRACATGVRFWRRYFGGRLLARLRSGLTTGEPKLTPRDAVMAAQFAVQSVRALLVEARLRAAALRARCASCVWHGNDAVTGRVVPE